jgi:environmental stress-induced protein Ves
MSAGLKVMSVAEAAPERWANDCGWTRTLLAWPEPQRWVVRVSVADVETAGPFSLFAGVDRWFAVLAGDGVRLTTAGRAPVVVRATDEDMHAFPGDDPTGCELLGGPTRDLNVMNRRQEASTTIRRTRGQASLRSNAALVGCFVCDDTVLALDRRGRVALPRHTLAWLENPGRDSLEIRLGARAPRGWWIEANRDAADDHPTDR